ncbi:hypothetical protein Tco_0532314 [Tanacetum coccineum]
MSMNYEFDPFEDNMTASLNDQPIDEDEEDSSTEEGDSDSEDDDDYFVDEDTYLEEVNVDMADYHFKIDAEVEWVRHANSRQRNDHDQIPGPSNIEEVTPTKKTTKVKGKKDFGPSDAVEPNKKGMSLGGRGMPKPLAADECP